MPSSNRRPNDSTPATATHAAPVSSNGNESQLTTKLVPGVVDVVVMTPAAAGRRSRWRILTLRRASGVRCTGAWEVVHGSIESDELPAAAAVREVLEETGLQVSRLYSITVNPFYVPRSDTIQLAIVFAAIIDRASAVKLSEEHDAFVWRTPSVAQKYLAWPREREAVGHVMQLLGTGNAGPLEDVLLVRP